MRAIILLSACLACLPAGAQEPAEGKTTVLIRPDGTGAIYLDDQRIADIQKAAKALEELPLPEPKPIEPEPKPAPVPTPPKPEPKVPDECKPPLCIRFKTGTELIQVRPDMDLPQKLDRQTLDRLTAQ